MREASTGQDRRQIPTFFMSGSLPVTNRPIHIGEEIRKRLEVSGMSIKEFARRLCCERHSVYYIFKQGNIDINRLLKISAILDFDFLALYRENSTTACPSKLGIIRLTDDEAADFRKMYPEADILDL